MEREQRALYPSDGFGEPDNHLEQAMGNRVQDLFPANKPTRGESYPAPKSPESLPRRAAGAAMGMLSGRKKGAADVTPLQQ